MVAGDDGLYLHQSVIELYGIALPRRRIPMTQLSVVDITSVLSPAFRLRGGHRRSTAEDEESDESSSAEDEASAGDESAGDASYAYLRGGSGSGSGAEVSSGIHLLDVISRGVIGYGTSERKILWRDEIERLFRHRASILTYDVPGTDVVVKVPSGFKACHVDTMLIGHDEDDDGTLSIYIHPLASPRGIGNVLDMADADVMESMYQVIGRNVSYAGAMYGMMSSPRVLRLAIAPTEQGMDPIIEVLAGVMHTMATLVRSPGTLTPPDPPLEKRGRRNVRYALDPSQVGGRALVERVSELMRNGMMLRMSGGDEMFARILGWIDTPRSGTAGAGTAGSRGAERASSAE